MYEPNNIKNRYRKAECLLQTGLPHEAIGFFKECLEKEPNNV